MSEAAKPKRTRTKARTAAMAIDSQAAHSVMAETVGDSAPGSAAASRPASYASTQAEQEPPAEATPAMKAGQQDAGNASSDDSHAPMAHNTPQAHGRQAQQAGTLDAGNVPKPPSSSGTASPPPHVRWPEIRERLMKHAEWGQIIGTVKEMRLDPKLAKMRAEHRERFIWGELDRLYPPPVEGKSATAALLETKPEPAPLRDGSVKGLGDIPPGWPPLPANAALSVELGWVQANRLYVVEDLASGGTRVHLDRAHEPAPSRSAIGWLETSIRSYAKFVEVAAKASGPGDEDGEQMKRERMAIEEIRGLLAEMAGNSTGPGR